MGFFNKKKRDQENKETKGSELAQSLIRVVNCPCQVFPKGGTVQEVNEAYHKAFARGRKEGFFPALLCVDDVVAEWLGILEDESYSKENILKQDRQDGADILKKRYEEYMEDYVDDMGEGGDGTDSQEELVLSELMGEMGGGEELNEMTAFVSYTEPGIQETILFEIPVKNPWELIAWLPMGGWNECPEASEMMAVCRYWYEQYGAIPAAFSHDTLEFVLEKPVEGEEVLWKLAKEHYAFCPDRADQSTANGTIGEVADSLRQSKVWFFWWD